MPLYSGLLFRSIFKLKQMRYYQNSDYPVTRIKSSARYETWVILEKNESGVVQAK